MSFTIANNVRVELTVAITGASTSITVSKAVAPNQDPPAPAGGFPGLITLVDRVSSPTKVEIVEYTGRTDNGTTWTLTGVTRAREGTAAQSFDVGAIAFQSVTAGILAAKANASQLSGGAPDFIMQAFGVI